MKVDFYQLGGQAPEQVVALLAPKVLGQGGRMLVVSGDAGLAERIDSYLWAQPPESFLPHARAGGEHDARQPVLIADSPTAANAARHIALADGVWREEALGFDRAFHLFGEANVEAAREAWRALGKVEGLERNYWRREDGRWTKVA